MPSSDEFERLLQEAATAHVQSEEAPRLFREMWEMATDQLEMPSQDAWAGWLEALKKARAAREQEVGDGE